MRKVSIMKQSLRLLPWFASALLWVSAAFGDEPPAKAMDVHVAHAELASYTIDHIQISFTLRLKASRDLTIDGMAFSKMRVSGIPIYVSSIRSKQEIKSGGEFVTPPLLLTLRLHDLDSLDPLRSSVADGSIHLTGTAFAEVELPTMARLVLFTQRVRIALPIDSTIPIQIPGGTLGRMAALAVINSAQPLLDNGGHLRGLAQQQLDRNNELWKLYAPRILLLRSSCQLTDNKGHTQEFSQTAVGLRLEGKRILLPRQLLEPWKFDPELALNFKQQHLKVENFDLAAWPLDAATVNAKGETDTTAAWTLGRGELRIPKQSKDDDTGVYVVGEHGSHVKVKLDQAANAQDLSIVEILPESVKPLPAFDTDRTHPLTGKYLYYFRFPAGAEGSSAQPELASLPMPTGGDLSSDEVALDFTAIGSPLITEQGVAGIILDEHAALPISKILGEPPAAPAAVTPVAPTQPAPAVVTPATPPAPAAPAQHTTPAAEPPKSDVSKPSEQSTPSQSPPAAPAKTTPATEKNTPAPTKDQPAPAAASDKPAPASDNKTPAPGKPAAVPDKPVPAADKPAPAKPETVQPTEPAAQ
jgi:hypothetical protein